VFLEAQQLPVKSFLHLSFRDFVYLHVDNKFLLAHCPDVGNTPVTAQSGSQIKSFYRALHERTKQGHAEAGSLGGPSTGDLLGSGGSLSLHPRYFLLQLPL
jgi:hypothetical protein